MSGEPEPLSPPEERVRSLLVELRETPDAPADIAALVRTLRWQRPVRRALVTIGVTAGALGGGLRALLGMRRR